MITTLGRRETSLRLPVIDKMQDIAVDLETRDPDLKTKAPGWVHGNGHICGICISAKEGSFYIPIGHEQGENFDQSVAMKWLQDLMLAPDFDAVFHNAHYDVGWLTQQYGIKITRRIVDTMLAAPLIDEDRFNYGLDALAKDYIRGSKGKDEAILEEEIKKQFEYDYVVDIEKVSIRKKTGGRKSNQELPNFLLRPDRDEYIILSKSKATKTLHFTIKKREMKSYLWKLDGESVREYGEQDARLTLNLWKIFKPMIKAQQLEKVFELECGLIMPLIEMRKVGVKVDIKRAEALKIKYTKIIEENQDILDKIAGHPLSITDKGGDLVNTCIRLKIPFGKTAEGNPSFAEENVPEGHDYFYGPLKTIKKYTKARDVFLTSYLSYCIGDRVHPQFNQLKGDDGGTITGRFSCTSPNLQNIPVRDPDIGPELRSIFIPEDGEVWLALDYSAQEPRMLVHLAIMMGKAFGFDRCPSALIAMEERFSGRDSDFHTEVAKAVIDQQYVPVIRKTDDKKLEEYFAEHISNLPWVHSSIDSMLSSMYKGKKEHYEENLIGTYLNFEQYYETIPQEEKEFNKETLIKFLYKKFRTPAKAIGLGVMYGRGVASIVEGLRMGGMHLTIPEAQDIKTAVMVAVPFLAMVNTFYENMAKTKGYVTTVLGRRGRFPKYEVLDFSDWKDDSIKKEDKRRKFNVFNTAKEASKFYADEVNKGNEGVNYPQRAAAYTALNKVIQGGSADQAKVAILEVYKAGHIKKLRLMVHDELGLSIKPGVDDPKIFQDIMENCIDLYCQSKCDPSTGRNWYEAK